MLPFTDHRDNGMAEGGFEPTRASPRRRFFKTGAINRSTTPPVQESWQYLPPAAKRKRMTITAFLTAEPNVAGGDSVSPLIGDKRARQH